MSRAERQGTELNPEAQEWIQQLSSPKPRRLFSKGARERRVHSNDSDCPRRVVDSVVFTSQVERERDAEFLMVQSLFHVEVEVLGTRVQALVDTGAQFGLIDETLLADIVCVREEADVDVRGLGNANVSHVKESVKLELRIHGIDMKPVRFLVVNELAPQLVLGMSFFIVNGLTVNPSRGRMSRVLESGAKEDIYFGEEEKSCRRIVSAVRCLLQQPVRLDGGSWNKVRVSAAEKFPTACNRCPRIKREEFLFDGLGIEENLNANVVVMSGIVDSDSTFEVLVRNISDKPVGMVEGAQLGLLYTLLNEEELEVNMVTEEQGISGEKWTERKLREELVLDQGLDELCRNRIYQLLLRHRAVLSVGDFDVHRAALTSHRIELYDDTPIRQRPRRFPAPVAEEIERQCQELCMLDIIEPSTSPWSSPVVPVKKKDGTIRMCIDYRRLNAVTKPDRFPMPNLSDAVFSLHGMQYFTSLDLVKGYHQMPIDEASREYTAFSTTRGHYHFKSLSFGLRNAPAAFQREVQALLSGFPQSKIVIYIDDILIMERDFESHLVLVDKVLAKLEEASVKLKPGKCHWFKSEVPYLGHIVGIHGLKKDPQYVENVMNYPRPRTVRQIREFLGLVNFQRKFIPKCSELAAPLSSLTGGKSNQKVDWTEAMEQAFYKLKSEMAKEVSLAFPDYSPDA